MAVGISMVIDDKFLERLSAADTKLEELAKKSEEVRGRVVTSFRSMGDDGVSYFIQKINEAKAALQGLNVNGSVSLDVKGLDKLPQSASMSADNINTLITSITKLAQANASMVSSSKSATTSIKDMFSFFQEKISDVDKLAKAEEALIKQNEILSRMQIATVQQKTKDVNYEEQLLAIRQKNSALTMEKNTTRELEEVENNRHKAAMAQHQAESREMQAIAIEQKRIADEKVNAAQRSTISVKEEANAIKQSLAEQRKAAMDISLDTKKYRNQIKLAAEQDKTSTMEAIALEKERQAQLKRSMEEVKRLAKAYKEMPTLMSGETFNKLLGESASAVSINQRITAIHNLKNSLRDLDTTDKDYKKNVEKVNAEIARLTKELNGLGIASNNVQKSHRNLMDISGQLARKLALVFSVSQIQGYISKLASVRGEFELQQKSLQVLLQNRDEANKLWQQTVELAVKSPFRVSELVSYTRQLAAYRIETSKLHETTRRLADVSAGLGVDMNRLILAYGQVRAAEYLRGTELRQFTEAGIPMLDELAKRFSALEGRMITAGDVFERISKRMVSFKDVAAVFDTMTSAGGNFYRMQEQQSETLKGQISNLHDAIDLMLNDIGKANDGTLKGGVQLARSVVDNWREVAFILTKIIYTMVPAKLAMMSFALGTKNAAEATLWWNNAMKVKIGTTMADIRSLTWQEAKILGVTRAQYMAGKATLYFQGALRGVGIALKTIAPFLAIGLILELWRRMTEASRAAEELRKNLNKLVNEDYGNVKTLSENYKSLVTQLRNANEGSKERRDIIAKLNSQYGEYLDMVVDEKTNVNDLAAAYEDVLKRMKEKAALSTMEKGLNTIAESYGSKLDKAEEKFRNLFKGASIKKLGDNFGYIIPTEDDIDNIMSLLQTRIRELDAEQLDSLQEQQDIIQEIVKKYYGQDFYLGRDYSKSIELINILIEKKKEEEKLEKRINSQYKETLKSREANLALEKLNNEYKKKQIDINKEANLSDFEVRQKLEKAKERYELDKIELKLQFGEISETEAQRAKERILNWATDTVKDVNEKLRLDKDLFGYTEEQMATIYISQEEQAQGMAAVIKHTIDGWNTANEIIAEQISLKSAGLSIDERTLKKYQDQEVLFRQRAKALGIELKYVTKINEETWKSINAKLPNEYMITLEDSYKSINTLLDDYTKKENESLTLLKRIYEQKKRGLEVDNSQVKKLKEQIEQYREIRKMLGEVIEPSISKESLTAINSLLPTEYQINFADSMKSVTELQNDANTAKEKAIKLNETYQNQIAQGIPVEDELIEKTKADIEWYTKKWQYLGGIEEDKKKGSGRSNSLYDERLKVIDDMNKKYKEINKTLGETDALQGAFSAYVDAFATAYNEISWIPKNVRQMTAEEFATQVLNFPNEDALVTFLDKLSKEPMKTFEKIKVELAKGKYVYDMKVNAKVFDDKELIQQIEDLFSGYELSIELDKMNVPANMAKDLFDIDATSLDELKAKLQDFKPLFIGTDMEEQYKKYLDKISDMEDKARMERLKKYTSYLIAAQSEAVKIKLEEARKIAEIESMAEMTPAQKEIAKGAVREETQKKLDKQQWEDFKNTDIYIELFEDLDNVSTKTLNRMKEKLVEMRDSLKNLDPSQLKEIAKRIEEVNEALVTKNPFKGIVNGIKNAVKSYNAYQKAADKALASQQDVDSQQKVVDNLQLQVEEQRKVVYEKQNSSDVTIAEQAVEQAYLSQLENELATQKKILKEKKAQNNESQKEKQNAKEILGLTKDQLSKSAQQLNEGYAAFTDLTDTLQTMFGTFDESTQDFLENVGSVIEGIAQVENGLSQILDGKIITGSLNMVTGVFKTIGGFFGFGNHDKKKERQIQREIKKVEDLQHAYEKLEKAIDDAYAIDTLQKSTKNAKENLQAQINSYNKMIAAEQDKKKTDQDRIKEWQYAIEDLREQIKELDEQAFNQATGGIIDNVLNAATEFTDAWLEAFKETGNGLSGLQDNFNEAVVSMLKQQASLLITQAYVEKWKKELERYINPDDLELTTQEAKQWVDVVKSSLPQLNSALEEYFKAMQAAGIDLNGDNDLSGLTRGIQNVTESTAEEISAYLSSVRFYVAEQNTIMQQLANVLNMQEVENPMVTQLKIIAQQTTAINSLLQGMTAPHTSGGRGLKVVM